MIEFGDKARDTVTGFVGIVTGKARYMYGCNQLLLMPRVDAASSKPAEGAWFDEPRIRVVDAGAIAPESVQGEQPGGPSDAPLPPAR